ncbi:MAG TPA: hypothetical protein IAC14_14105 [Candidatus Scybalomonas excrementigallinarum]|nr:hypothetical protein [Candidatus Scybalomonas excrementigallinarum]
MNKMELEFLVDRTRKEGEIEQVREILRLWLEEKGLKKETFNDSILNNYYFLKDLSNDLISEELLGRVVQDTFMLQKELQLQQQRQMEY